MDTKQQAAGIVASLFRSGFLRARTEEGRRLRAKAEAGMDTEQPVLPADKARDDLRAKYGERRF